MYGWRARIGVLIPSGITIMESTLNSLLPEGVFCHYTRYNFTGGRTGDEKDVMERLARAEEFVEDATKLIVHARPSVVVFGGTGTSFIGGFGHDQKLIEIMQAASGGLPATTTSTAVIKALKALGISKISLAAPYVEAATQALVQFVEAHGIKVLEAKCLGKAGPDVPNTPPEDTYELIRSVDNPDSEAIFVSCTNFDVINMIRYLETDLSKPVITSNQATLWDMLRLAGINDKINGYGKLLAEL